MGQGAELWLPQHLRQLLEGLNIHTVCFFQLFCMQTDSEIGLDQWTQKRGATTLQDCGQLLKAVLGNWNRWCICKLRQRSELDQNWNQFMDEDANQMRHYTQEHLSAVIVEQIVMGEVGAVAKPDVNADGCHLMKFTSEPFHCVKKDKIWWSKASV